MQLPDFVGQVQRFSHLSFAEQIRLFAWHLHHHGGKDAFAAPDIKRCFESLHITPPANLRRSLEALVECKPPNLIRSGGEFRLERRIREKYDSRYSRRPITVAVHKALSDLPGKLTEPFQRNYLSEAITCFQHQAYRAAMIMTWNLAYDHLCEHILTKNLADFNAQMLAAIGKKKITAVTRREDFQELKESEVLKVCRTALITSKSVDKTLEEKLTKRNLYAHPSGVVVTQPQAEEYIVDLIENAFLKLS